MSELSEEEVFLYATEEGRRAALEDKSIDELAAFALRYAGVLRQVGKDDATLLDAATVLYLWEKRGYITVDQKAAAARIAAQRKERDA